jgi:hypothetical protein
MVALYQWQFSLNIAIIPYKFLNFDLKNINQDQPKTNRHAKHLYVYGFATHCPHSCRHFAGIIQQVNIVKLIKFMLNIF